MERVEILLCDGYALQQREIILSYAYLKMEI